MNLYEVTIKMGELCVRDRFHIATNDFYSIPNSIRTIMKNRHPEQNFNVVSVYKVSDCYVEGEF